MFVAGARCASSRPQEAPQEPTLEAVEARAAELAAREDLEPALKAELAQRFERAAAELRQARTWAARKAELDHLAADAPALLVSIREELARPPDDPRPNAPPDATLKQLESSSEQAEAELALARQQVEDLKSEAASRTGRRTALPAELTEARGRAAQLLEAQRAPPPPGESPFLAESRELLLRAQLANVQREIAAREGELASYDARTELLPARRDLAQRRLARAEKLALRWSELVSEARLAQARRAAAEAHQQALLVANEHAELRALATRNEELANERLGPRGLSNRLEQTGRELAETRDSLDRLRARYQRVLARLQAGGRSTALGILLRKEYESLPRVDPLRARLEALGDESSDVQYRLIELEEERLEAGDVESRVQALADASAMPAGERASFEAVARELYTSERDLLDALIADYERYFERIVDLTETARSLIEETDAYEVRIEEHILWVRSVSGARWLNMVEAGKALAWIADPRTWAEAPSKLWRSATERFGPTILLVLLLVASLALHRRCLRGIRDIAPLAGRYKTDSFRLTLRGVALTIGAALPPGLALWILAGLAQRAQGPPVLQALGAGLEEGAEIVLPLEILRQTIRPKGLAEAHFRWPAEAVRTLRRNLRWFVPMMLGAVLLVVTMSYQGNELWSDSLGRLAFIATMLPGALFMYRVLRPHGAVLGRYMQDNTEGILHRLRYAILAIGAGLPVAFALLAGLGYYYSARQLAQRMQTTLVFVLALVLIDALASRWLLVARRRLAVEQALQRRAERAASAGAGEGSEADFADQVDIPALNAQTKRLFRSVTGVVVVLGLLFIWSDVLPALRVLRTVHVWPRLEIVSAHETEVGPELVGAANAPSADAPKEGEAAPPSALFGTAPGTSSLLASLGRAGYAAVAGGDGRSVVTLEDVLLALLLLALTWISTRNVPALLEMSVLQQLPLDAGARYATKTLVRYALAIIGITAAFGAVGIGWSKVQWLAAALTFGLAFGLQEIFANFVSGLIMLFERPIRLDDIVTVGGVEGRVAKIRMRATTILDWDRRELLVPNKEFLTGQLINWTLSDTITRHVVQVGIAYGSDVEKARELLLKVARDCRFVMNEPRPTATFRSFGDSALLFELRVYLATRDEFLLLVDDVNQRIDREFRAAGIEIAFPQLDLHLRSADAALRVERSEPLEALPRFDPAAMGKELRPQS